jgi:outer membrane lipoprotein carrier protein
MKKLLFVFIAATLSFGQDVNRTLKGVEDRYNNISTLEVDFSYTYSQGLHKSTHQGVLYLHKPKRMRWQFTSPEGDLFISDGEYLYDYDAKSKQAEKDKLKDTGDLRAPLAFLLGKLNFHEDFSTFKTDGSGTITAIPKSDKLVYTEVAFLAAPDYSMRQLTIKGQDGSVWQYSFENEKKNPPISDDLFHFKAPPGVQVVDKSRGN